MGATLRHIRGAWLPVEAKGNSSSMVQREPSEPGKRRRACQEHSTSTRGKPHGDLRARSRGGRTIKEVTWYEYAILAHTTLPARVRGLDTLGQRLRARPPAAPRVSLVRLLKRSRFPSPLLDWSRSPYVAAFFAFRNPVANGPLKCPTSPAKQRKSQLLRCVPTCFLSCRLKLGSPSQEGRSFSPGLDVGRKSLHRTSTDETLRLRAVPGPGRSVPRTASMPPAPARAPVRATRLGAAAAAAVA